MGQNIVKKSIINPITGEVMKENTFLNYDGFNTKGYKYRFRDAHIKIFVDSVPNSLSAEGFLLLYMLAEIANEDNVLVYKVTKKSKFSKIIYKPLDKEAIRKQLRYPYGENKFDRCWRELKKHCIKQVQYYDYLVWAINPAVISCCKQVPPWLYDEFRIYMDPHLTKLTIKKYQDMLKN